MSIFKKKRKVDVLTAVSFEARFTTYLDGKWANEKVLRGVIPETEMPAGLEAFLRRQMPKEEK